MEHILSQFVQPVYVSHVSYEPRTANWDIDWTKVEENDKEKWLSALFEYWNKKVEEGAWDGHEFAEMGVSVCGEPDEDSVCCCTERCEMCAEFKAAAGQCGIYEP
jgi:hypothetical protein